MKEKDIEIIKLKELNTEKDETLNMLKNDFDNLKNQLEQLTNKIKRNEEQTIDLQTFAERMSKLHSALSNQSLERNNHYATTLFQHDYDKNEEVTKWNEMVKEVNEDDNECNYLETLKYSINQYKETTYSPTFKKRLRIFATLPLLEFSAMI